MDDRKKLIAIMTSILLAGCNANRTRLDDRDEKTLVHEYSTAIRIVEIIERTA